MFPFVLLFLFPSAYQQIICFLSFCFLGVSPWADGGGGNGGCDAESAYGGEGDLDTVAVATQALDDAYVSAVGSAYDLGSGSGGELVLAIDCVLIAGEVVGYVTAAQVAQHHEEAHLVCGNRCGPVGAGEGV